MHPGMDSATAHQIHLEAQLVLGRALCTCASHSPAALSLLDVGKTYPSNKSPATIQRLFWGKDAWIFLRSMKIGICLAPSR